jgi:small subunit ribosomal protein S9
MEKEDKTPEQQPTDPGAEQTTPDVELAGEATPPEQAEPADEQQAEPEPEPQAEAPAQEEPVAEEAAQEEPVAVEAAQEEAAVEEAAQEEPVAEEAAAPATIALAAEARYSATGKRKSSIARVTLRPGSGGFELNGRTLDNYFPRPTLQAVVRQPLEVSGYGDRIDVRAKVHGGGVSSQADAVRHGISKALIEADPNLRGELKRRGLLTRDPRVKERKKAGLKKARKRPQFSKR